LILARTLNAGGHREFARATGNLQTRATATFGQNDRYRDRNRTPQDISDYSSGHIACPTPEIDVRTGDAKRSARPELWLPAGASSEVGPEGGRNTGIGSVVNSRPVPTAGPGALSPTFGGEWSN